MTAAIVTHLWQSTAIAVLIGVVTLAFRRHRAAVRHGMWLAASVKFLVPFPALVMLGGLIGIRTGIARMTIHREFTIVVNDPAGVLPGVPGGFDAPASFASPSSTFMTDAVLPVLAAVWIGGALLTLAIWAIRWRRLAAVARSAAPIESGPALVALRAIERRAGARKPIALVSSDTSLEPGVFGILKPVLVWPKAIAAHLGDDYAATILAHEVSHVRRRDNLTAAIHMVVEALFWFHPLVWWIGKRLVDERERACDEAVLQSGSEPEVYAQTIIEACRISIESPLPCVAGITGSDLNRRVERIMTNPGVAPLSLWRKTLLTAAAVGIVGAPIAAGAVSPPPSLRSSRVVRQTAEVFALRVREPLVLHVTPQSSTELPRFEVASIKPNKSGFGPVRIETSPGGRFTAVNVTLQALVQYAYRVQSFQVNGGPGWINADRFDIAAKGDDNADGKQYLMVRALLADRFKLIARDESREQPTYALIVSRADGRLGAALRPSTLNCDSPNPQDFNKAQKPEAGQTACGIRMGLGTMTMGGATLSHLATTLSGLMERLVVDRTGLAGAFDASLKWTPDQSTPGLALKAGYAPAGLVDPNGPSLFTAVQEQLGLKLDSQKGPVDVVVIDRAERPIEN